MFTQAEQPWVMYLEIDEETLESKLRADAPEDIREKYEIYLMEKRENPDVMWRK